MPAPRHPARREVFVLMALGLFVMLIFGDWARYGVDQLLPFVVAGGLLLVTPLVRGLTNLLERLRHPSPRAATLASLIVTVIAFAVLIGVPAARGYTFHPRSHDEQMHVLQMQMLAHGRLWMPAHPVGDFFETFFVLTRPVYCSIYFPGASLIFTPTVWLHLPYWFLPVLYSAIAVGLMYRVLVEVADGAAALLGVIVMLSLPMFREMALGMWSHNMMLMLALAVTWAWLTRRRTHTLKWAAVAGALAGLAAITRPVEAVCYVTPLAVASVFVLRRMNRRAMVKTLLLTIAAAMPFIALQLAFNAGTTGRLLYSPYQLYLDTQQPRSSFGFHTIDENVRPQSQLAQKQLYYEKFIRPAVQKHRPAMFMVNFLAERFPVLLATTLPHPFVVIFLLVGLLGLRSARDRGAAMAMWAALPMLMLAYAFNAFLMAHYMVIWLPPIVLMIVLIPEALRRTFVRPANLIPAAALLFVIAAAVAAQPGLNPHATEQFQTPVVSDAREKLAALPHVPAVVFFTYDVEGDFDDEPVYNLQTPWPDDAQVIRAHDLGARNVESIRYYAQRQPERFFYQYDQATKQLRELGPAKVLLEQVEATTTTTTTTTTKP